MQMEASALERIAEVALAVGGQYHRRLHNRHHGSEFGDTDLIIRQDFEQQRFEFGVRLVDLVDKQHAAPRLLQSLEQRARLHEFLGKKHVAEIVQLVERRGQRIGAAEHFAELVLQDLGVKQLL